MDKSKKSKTNANIKNGNGKKNGRNFFDFLNFDFKAPHFNTTGIILGFLVVFLLGILLGFTLKNQNSLALNFNAPQEHWMLLERGQNREFLYLGVPGDKEKSTLMKEFKVKVGVPGEKPTPLPSYFGKSYWKIIKKYSSLENPETAPYFLELDVPVEDVVFGPIPYNECNGQCNWELPGYFGLHGVNGDLSRLSDENPGSSGCIRHTDEDITYLYNTLNIDEGVRYYITP